MTSSGRPALTREILAGLNVLTMSLPMASAAGVIAYSPLGPGQAALGAVAGLLTAAMGGLVSAILRSNNGVVVTAANSSASVQASALALVVGTLADRPALLPAVLPVFALAIGGFQIAFGLLGFARLVKFVPFPVVSGFVSGIGLLLVLKFCPVLIGTVAIESQWTGGRLLTPPDPTLACFSAALLVFAFGAQRWLPRGWPVTLVACMAGILAYHALASLGRAGTLGGTLDASAVGALVGLASGVGGRAGEFGGLLLDREAVAAILLGAATVALVTLLEFVFTTRAAQSVADVPASPRRDLVGLGAGSIATSIFGAVAFSATASQTMLNYAEGGRTRVSTMVAAGALLLILLAVPGVLAFVPVCIFPALIMFVGWRLIDPYTGAVLRGAATRAREPAREQARRDAIVHLSVLLPTALTQPLLGVAAGIVLSCIVFILSMSRPVVRRIRDGRTASSKRMHIRAELDALEAVGREKVVMDLEGALFFANAEDLAVAIKERHEARYLILNMRGVTDVDATGARILEQLRRMLAGRVVLVAADIPPEIAPTMGRIFPPEHRFEDLDDALEFAEQRLLAESPPSRADASAATAGGIVPLDRFDLCEGFPPSCLRTFSGLLLDEEHPAGAVLCHEGDPADRIWLIRSGAISVRIRSAGADRRVVAFGAGSALGEMAVIEGKARSATLVADEDVVLSVLPVESYRHILANEPELAAVLFRNLARTLSDRLRARSVELRAASA